MLCQICAIWTGLADCILFSSLHHVDINFACCLTLKGQQLVKHPVSAIRRGCALETYGNCTWPRVISWEIGHLNKLQVVVVMDWLW